MARKVKFHDIDTGKTVEVPASELASTSVGANVRGVGEVWIDGDRIKSPPLRHGRLPGKTLEAIRRIAGTLADVYPRTIEQWEDAFRRDADPEREVAIWTHVAATFRKCTEGKPLSLGQRKEFLRVILAYSMSPDGSAEVVLDNAELSGISREDAAEALRLYDAIP